MRSFLFLSDKVFVSEGARKDETTTGELKGRLGSADRKALRGLNVRKAVEEAWKESRPKHCDSHAEVYTG